jgi:FAD/FMN-containing dehydrogenase
MINRRPAAVVRVGGVDEVVTTVNFARDHGFDLAIRGGGHSAPGFGTVDDGIVIDFSDRTRVEVDPVARRVRAEAGATWATFNQARHKFGLATTGGIVGRGGRCRRGRGHGEFRAITTASNFAVVVYRPRRNGWSRPYVSGLGEASS